MARRGASIYRLEGKLFHNGLEVFIAFDVLILASSEMRTYETDRRVMEYQPNSNLKYEQ